MSLVDDKAKFIYSVGWIDCWMMFAPLIAESKEQVTQQLQIKRQYMLKRLKDEYLSGSSMQLAAQLVSECSAGKGLHNTIMDIMRQKMHQDEMINELKKGGWKIDRV